MVVNGKCVITLPPHPDNMLEIGFVTGFEFATQSATASKSCSDVAIHTGLVLIDLTDVFIVCVVVVKCNFIVHPHSYEHRYTHGNGQADDIDRRVSDVSGDASESNLLNSFLIMVLGVGRNIRQDICR
jgi:hypothetical protein